MFPLNSSLLLVYFLSVKSTSLLKRPQLSDSTRPAVFGVYLRERAVCLFTCPLMAWCHSALAGFHCLDFWLLLCTPHEDRLREVMWLGYKHLTSYLLKIDPWTIDNLQFDSLCKWNLKNDITFIIHSYCGRHTVYSDWKAVNNLHMNRAIV